MKNMDVFVCLGVATFLVVCASCRGDLPSDSAVKTQGTQTQKKLPMQVGGAWEMLNALSMEDLRALDQEVVAYAFPLLTPSGKTLFLKARQYMEVQKQSQFHSFAQHSSCALNVSHIIWNTPSNLAGRSRRSYAGIVDLVSAVEQEGGRRYVFDPAKDDLTGFWNAHFATGIPTGTLVTGLSKNAFDPSSGHVGVVGDYNHSGEIMLYNNNWFRPGSLKCGQGCEHFVLRRPYMISLHNLYQLRRPRQWMPTPWVRVKKKSSGAGVSAVTPLLPHINDLHLGNTEYTFTFVVPGNIHRESVAGKVVATRKFFAFPENVHGQEDAEGAQKVCQTTQPIKQIAGSDARTKESAFYQYYSSYTGSQPLDNPLSRVMEFHPLRSPNTQSPYYAALLYHQNMKRGASQSFWGEGSQELLIHKKYVRCLSKKQWHERYKAHKNVNP